MLMPCHRHTPQDLELWAEHEAADLVHAREARFERLIVRSLDAIREFVQQPCYCSISGGKDSTVMAHLVSRVTQSIPVRWLATEPLVDPHCREVLASLVDCCGFTDYREHVNWCRHDETGWHASGTMEAGIDAIATEVGTERCLLGLRADESSVRKLRCQRWGMTTGRSCAPLAWWTAQDVYAYAALHNLPLHPTYGMMGQGRWPRDRLRVSFLTLTHGRGHGRLEWEREYYGDVLRRLES